VHLHMTHSYTASLCASSHHYHFDPGRTHMSLYPCRCVCCTTEREPWFMACGTGRHRLFQQRHSPPIVIRVNFKPLTCDTQTCLPHYRESWFIDRPVERHRLLMHRHSPATLIESIEYLAL